MSARCSTHLSAIQLRPQRRPVEPRYRTLESSPRAPDEQRRPMPEADALPAEELLSVELDVLEAVRTVSAAAAALAPLRPKILSIWKHFDFQQIDRLEQYAHALSQAELNWRALQKSHSSRRRGALDSPVSSPSDQRASNRCASSWADAASTRRRAITALVHAYSAARQVLNLVESPAEVDRIAPPLRRSPHARGAAPRDGANCEELPTLRSRKLAHDTPLTS